MGERATLTKTSGKEAKDSVSAAPKQTVSKSINSPVEQILYLQQTVGNRAVQGLFNSGVIQAKLKIGQPNDIYEQEADRMADQVMRMMKPKGALAQRKAGCPECIDEEEEVPVQAKQSSNQTPHLTPAGQNHIQSMKGGGQPMPKSVRNYFEPRFGHDFSQVRIHTGAKAEESARQINALAYTVGDDIVAGAGQFAPETMAGRRLLAHELTHVVQQRGKSAAASRAAPSRTLFRKPASRGHYLQNCVRKVPRIPFSSCERAAQECAQGYAGMSLCDPETCDVRYDDCETFAYSMNELVEHGLMAECRKERTDSCDSDRTRALREIDAKYPAPPFPESRATELSEVQEQFHECMNEIEGWCELWTWPDVDQDLDDRKAYCEFGALNHCKYLREACC